MTALQALVAERLAREVAGEVSAAAARLAKRLGGTAVLFYGSALRTRDLDGVLDFYVLVDAWRGSRVRRAANRWLWPEVGFHEIDVADRIVRAKVAVMPLATFERAARGATPDTTIWTRFAQPCALVWTRDAATAERVAGGVVDAAVTACRYAAVLGPDRGEAADYWRALFRQTYRAELRIEPSGREEQILANAPDHYAVTLPLAWEAGGVAFAREDDALVPDIAPTRRRAIERAWARRRRIGRALNLARLAKATFTFAGAARYGAWKLERHTGIALTLSPWQERHPILAAPGVLWTALRARRA